MSGVSEPLVDEEYLAHPVVGGFHRGPSAGDGAHLEAHTLHVRLCLYLRAGLQRAVELITVALGVFVGFDTLTIIAVTLSGVVFLFSILWLVLFKTSFSKFRTEYLAIEKSSLTYDEDGIEVGMNGTATVRIPWKKVKFIREFDEYYTVFEDSTTNALLIPVKYKDQVYNYIKENGLNLTMY